MGGGGRRSFPTIDISPNDSDVDIVSAPKPPPVARNTDGPSMVAFPLTKTTAERKFWSGAPAATESEVEVDLAESPPLPRRRARSILSKVLFLAIFSVALTLLACEVSIAFKIPWLDPRPALVGVKRFAIEKISHLRAH